MTQHLEIVREGHRAMTDFLKSSGLMDQYSPGDVYVSRVIHSTNGIRLTIMSKDHDVEVGGIGINYFGSTDKDAIASDESYIYGHVNGTRVNNKSIIVAENITERVSQLNNYVLNQIKNIRLR